MGLQDSYTQRQYLFIQREVILAKYGAAWLFHQCLQLVNSLPFSEERNIIEEGPVSSAYAQQRG
jgi:hypothetical protein